MIILICISYTVVCIFLEPVWMNAEYIITSEGKCERCPLYQIIEPAFPDTIKEVLWDVFLMIVVYTCISPTAPWEPALVPRDACLFTFMGRYGLNGGLYSGRPYCGGYSSEKGISLNTSGEGGSCRKALLIVPFAALFAPSLSL